MIEHYGYLRMDIAKGEIYESPDGGLTVYARKVGSDPGSRRLVHASDSYYQLKKQEQEEKLWKEIRQAADTDPELSEILERAVVYYTLKHA